MISGGENAYIIYIYDNRSTVNDLNSQLFMIIVQALLVGLLMAMSLKVVVRMPISSEDSTVIVEPKSPAATCSARSVSRSMGIIMVLLSRKLSRTDN